jgi:integrase
VATRIDTNVDAGLRRNSPFGRQFDLIEGFDVLEHIQEEREKRLSLRESLVPGGFPHTHRPRPSIPCWTGAAYVRTINQMILCSRVLRKTARNPTGPATLRSAFGQQRSGPRLIGMQRGRCSGTATGGDGPDAKTIKELMRHANSKTTMDVYVQTVTPAKREAHGKVLQNLVVPICSHARVIAST